MASSGDGTGKGRKRIKMEKMKKDSNLQVTFSKRRKGAIKKAYELTILTGAEVALIVFSPGGKVYSFGHPTIEEVANRFLNGISQPLTPTRWQIQNEFKAKVAETNANLTNVKNQLEFERNRAEVLDKQLAESQGQHWGSFNMDEKNQPLLQQSVEAMKNLTAKLEMEINSWLAMGQHNFGIPTNSYNHYSREVGLVPQSLMETIHHGSGSRSVSNLPPLKDHIMHAAGNDSAFFPFAVGPGGHEVGGRGSVVPSQVALGFQESGGAWPFNVGSSSSGGGVGPFIAGPSSFIGGGGGGGQSLSAGPSFFAGGSSDPFIVGPNCFSGGGDLLNTYGVGSSGVGDVGGSSNPRVLRRDGSPHDRFGDTY